MRSLRQKSPVEIALEKDAAELRERLAIAREKRVGVDAFLEREGIGTKIEAIPGYSPEGRR